MKNRVLCIWMAVLAIAFTSCSSDDTEPEPSLDILTSLSFEPGVTSQTLSFESNRPWEVSVKETRAQDLSWITVSPDRGEAGQATVTVSVEHNYTEIDRSGYLHLKINGMTKSVQVNQKPIELSIPESVIYEKGEKLKAIAFDAKESWTARVMPEEASQWLTLLSEGEDAGVAVLSITSADNYTRSAREATVEITIGGVSKSISVTQEPWIVVVADDEPTAPVAAGGFYVANEDWFGWDNGTLNYFKSTPTGYEPSYRVYRAVNSNESDWFGSTTQHATIWGDKVYFTSKQGNRLVIADAATLQKKAIFPTIGGDGRMFVGVDDKKGYVGHSGGITVLDLNTLTLGYQVVSGEVGSMCYAAGKLFAVSRSNLYIVDTATDALVETIPASCYTITQSKDGDVWVATSAGLLRYDPETLDNETIAYPTGASVASPWFAWNAGSLCASTQNNVLYWTSGTKVVKYDIETGTANAELFTLPRSEHDVQLGFYGAGLRVDPLTDELILTVKHSGWGASGAYNWIYKLDASGAEITNFKVKGDNGVAAGWGGNAEDWDGKYFWFPATPFFEDANRPQILLNQILLAVGETITVDLSEKIVDYDNTAASMIATVEFADGGLVSGTLEGSRLTLTAGGSPGTTTCTVGVVSNGVRVEKSVQIDIEG